METSRLGSLAVARGLATEEQLQRCLELQEKSSPPRFLGEVLVEEGVIKPAALRHLLTAQHRAQGEHLYSSKETAKRLKDGDLSQFLQAQTEIGAQELYLASGARPQVRRNGRLHSIRPEPMTSEHCRKLFLTLLDEASFERFMQARSLDTVHTEPGLGRFRVHLFMHMGGPAGQFWHIPKAIPTIEQLRLPKVVSEVPRLPHGLVLVTGPRSSGKTTTLAALVELINDSRRRHVITLEEPIEFVHESRLCLISQRQVGLHVPDWRSALISALREDPDVILVGNLEGHAAVATALTAAEAGSLVLGSMQTPGAKATLLRILEAYPGDRHEQVRSMLAASLRFIVSQQLVPSGDGERLHLAAEVLRNTSSVAGMIRDGRLHRLEDAMQTARDQGMVLMDDALLALVEAGRVSVGEAASRANQPRRIVEAS